MKKTIALFWFMLALAVVNQVSAQIPSDGLVGYWPFTGNANDASGNGNNGIIYASLTTDRFGNPNSAYNFNQGSKIEVPMTQQLFELPVRSFSCWFRLSANQTGGRIYETTFQNGGIGFYAGSIFDTWYGYSQHCCNIVGLSGGPIGLWHHLVVNSNDNTGFTQVYLDGVQISTSNGYPAGNGCFSNTVWQWQGAFMRFGQGASGEAYFGDIDDISIYNRVLTPAEISQLYTDQTSLVEVPCVPFLGEDQTVCAGTSVTLSASSASTGVTCPTLPSNLQTGLVGYWPFCGNANDESGNGNNGTVNGATLTTDRFGNANSAYVFDNSSNTQDITLSTVPIIGGQNWSISFYFKTSSSLRQGLITLGNGSITKDCIQIFI
ncbi:MAG: LamG domain-containing protein, partial [Bacteroidota bacterium]